MSKPEAADKKDVSAPAGENGAPPTLLTIAGFDPSSGAGVTADMKVFAAHGCFGLSCMTAETIQSTQGVRRVRAADASWVRETLDCLQDDMTIAGIKIGMLATAANVRAVSDFLASAGVDRDKIVLDPVMVSSSGSPLLEPEGVACLREVLLPQVGWVTPNLAELTALTGLSVRARADIPGAAAGLRALAEACGHRELNVLVTGGHLEEPEDYLLGEAPGVWIPGRRVETTATHGTGCALSSALLCQLVRGRRPWDAAESAKRYVEEAMRCAYPVGKGRGPMHHLFAFDEVASRREPDA